MTADGAEFPRFRFTLSAPPDGVYYATLTWRETGTSAAVVDADEVVVLPLAVWEPWLAVTGADLARIVGNTHPRAALDAAARIVSGHLEGYTRGRSVRPDPLARHPGATSG